MNPLVRTSLPGNAFSSSNASTGGGAVPATWTAPWAVGVFALLLVVAAGLPSAARAQQTNQVQTDLVRQAQTDFHGRDRAGKDGPLARVGLDLALLYREFRRHQQTTPNAPFTPLSMATETAATETSGAAALARPSTATPVPQNGFISPVRGDYVVVDAVARGAASTLEAEVRRLGGQDVERFRNVVSARLPILRIPELAALSSLQAARPALARVRRKDTKSLREALRRSRHASRAGHVALPGSTVSQGDAAMNTDDVRASLGIDGSGITIGVLSDTYDALGGAAGDMATNDLPPAFRIDVLEDLDSGTDEGRAMMQLIYDVAPGADQSFHTAFGGQANFANGIIELADAGADVTTDDVGYFAEPFFQDGIIAQAVNIVSANGVPHFSSAGNDATQSYESGDVRFVQDTTGTALYDFAPGADSTDTRQSILVGPASQFGTARIILQWDDPFASASGGSNAADTDLDIAVLTASGDTVALSNSPNIGGDPLEIVQFANTTGATQEYVVRISNPAGPLPGRVKYVHNGAMLVQEYATNSSTSAGHNIAEGGAGIGASFYQTTPAFDGDAAEPESFTSLGGTPILFDADGTRKATPEVREQPRFTGPDGTNTTFFGSDAEGDGFPNFFGTSAAAPHVAALAALQLQADPSLSPEQVYANITAGADDMAAPGYDFLTGAGLVNAQNTIEGTTGEQDIEIVTPTSLDFGTQFFNADVGALFTPATRLVQIANTGTADLTITSVSFTGEAFVFVGDGISEGTTLGSSERIDVMVAFEPPAPGAYTGELAIESDDPDEQTASITLAGEAALPPVAEVSENGLAEAVEVGSTATQTLAIANPGNAVLEYDLYAEALGLGPFAPGEIAAPPVGGTARAARPPGAAAAGVGTRALPAAARRQSFDPSAFVYTIDDGSVENSLGIGQQADIFWLNAFQAQEGATTITAIATDFGSSLPLDAAADFLLYEDPTDDGDPADAELLRTVPATVEAQGSSLQVEPLSPVQVEGVFFVAVLVQRTSSFPAPLDQSSQDQGASWFGVAPSGAFDASDPAGSSTTVSLLPTGTLGFPGNWVLRAQGSYVAFEPVSGTVAAGESETANVTFDATSLAPGAYAGNAAVETNDPTRSTIDVPFDLLVGNAAAEIATVASSGTYAFGGTGVELDLSGVSGSGDVAVVRIDAAPSSTDGIDAALNVSNYRWIVRNNGDLGFDASSTIRFARADIPTPGFDASNGPEVQVYRRPVAGTGTFSTLPTLYDAGGTEDELGDDALVASVSSFSEFVFASSEAPIPVELSGFDAAPAEGAVRLTWETASEANNARFEVKRRVATPPGTSKAGSMPWTDVGRLSSKAPGGTSSEPLSYSLTDGALPFETQTLTYRLVQIDHNGDRTVAGETVVEIGAPQTFALHGSFPNPMRDRTTIRYELPEARAVTVTVHDALGRTVRTLVAGEQQQGRQELDFEAEGLSSGVYFYRITAGDYTEARKLVLVH